ncbi:hypothetical protein LSAT2_012453, partial [Lamellibrachia satsuma]
HLVLLFSPTLIGGLQVEPELRQSRDVIERETLTSTETPPVNLAGTLTGRTRRRFDGNYKVIPAFLTSLKRAQFRLTPSSEAMEIERLRQQGIDFIWLLQSLTQKLPLFIGFFFTGFFFTGFFFVTDDLPRL